MNFVELFVHFVTKVPGILQSQISSRRMLRESICGEHFWKQQDVKRHTDADLETVDKLVSALELLNPGCVIVNGDGLTGVHGVRNDDTELSDDAKTVLRVRAIAESASSEENSYLHHAHGKDHKHHEHFNPYKRDHHSNHHHTHEHASRKHHESKPHRKTKHSDKPINHAAHKGHTTGGGHSLAHSKGHHSDRHSH